MELNSRHSQKGEDEDRLSMLPDDVLLSILGRVDIATAARTSAVSTRWKHLPWLLRELTIDVKDFLPTPHPNPVEAQHMDAAMASLTKAIRSLLGSPQREATIITRRLQLKLYLVNGYSDAVGPLLAEAIGTGSLKDLDLAILDEKEPVDCTSECMLHQACIVDGFFSACPSVIHCLTGLSLDNVCFAEWDMQHLLLDCCKQLRRLFLSNCDMGMFSAWKIQAPGSHLEVLEVGCCCLGKLEVLNLPKLERLCWDGWICPNAPLSLGVVPSLTELQLLCPANVTFQGFNLSDNLWLRPEGKQLCSVLSRLRKLSLLDIFIEFDLLWMMVLLEAALSVEMFDVEIWEHPCIVDTEGRRQSYGERTSPWK
uniref:F-box domain-containing protein n=1 Tax=Setaria italica TaxID=4555 RepID=K3YYL5_SETIT